MSKGLLILFVIKYSMIIHGKEEDLAANLKQAIASATQRHGFPISSEVETYLVSILTTYISAEKYFGTEQHALLPEMGRESLYLIYRQAQSHPYKLIALGDRCLFTIGLFYEAVRKKGNGCVTLYQDIGASSYARAGKYFENYGDDILTPIFSELASEFEEFSFLLGDIRLPMLDNKQLADMLFNYTLTRDPRYASLLQAKGIPVGSFRIEDS